MSFRGGIFSRGFSMTFGSEGSTQLQINDKNLERRSKNGETFSTDKWYRYEMRLVDDKADNCVAEYLKIMKLIDEDQYALAKFATGILASLIEFKEEPSGEDDRVRRWPILDAWRNFLGACEKIDIRNHSKVEKTLDRKMKWNKRSISSTNAQFYLANPEEYLTSHLSSIGIACQSLTSAQIAAVNKKKSIGRIADVKQERYRTCININ